MSNANALTIGKLARHGGVSVQTVRYYERSGLLLTVSHFRRNLAAMKFVGGEQAQAGCDFGF